MLRTKDWYFSKLPIGVIHHPRTRKKIKQSSYFLIVSPYGNIHIRRHFCFCCLLLDLWLLPSWLDSMAFVRLFFHDIFKSGHKNPRPRCLSKRESLFLWTILGIEEEKISIGPTAFQDFGGIYAIVNQLSPTRGLSKSLLPMPWYQTRPTDDYLTQEKTLLVLYSRYMIGREAPKISSDNPSQGGWNAIYWLFVGQVKVPFKTWGPFWNSKYGSGSFFNLLFWTCRQAITR